jgi:hypothetical protein
VATEQITVTVRSNLGEDGPLTVQDGLRQVLDLFDLLALASEHGGQEVSWNLVSISKSSPLTAIAAPFSVSPGMLADVAAREAKAFVSHAISGIMSGRPPPSWMAEEARDKTRAILSRNLGSIGRTDIIFESGDVPLVILEKTARAALASLDKAESEAEAAEPDFSHSEMGSIEGMMESAATYHGQPAIRVRERRTKTNIPCALAPAIADKFGAERPLREAWSGRRVIVVGQIFYKRDGSVSRVNASDVIAVEMKQFDEKKVFTSDFTGGLTPQRYLDSMWSADVG